ncbi:MAG: CHAT domain-containing protein [Bacteroidota bacterium]
MQFSGLPLDIIENEKKLTDQIRAYEEMMYNESIEQNPDSSRIDNIKNKLFYLKNDYDYLLTSIEKEYPEYYNLKYNPKFITADQVKENLNTNQAIIEYSYSDSLITCFVIDRNQVSLLSIPIPGDFGQECYDFYELIRNQSFVNDVLPTYQKYQELARTFYKVLMEPVLAKTRKRHITIIPDGPLVYLPFEAFLTSDVDPYYVNYTTLPYLIYNVSIGYSYSSTLLYSKRPETVKPLNRVLAYAPSYENLFNDTLQLVWNREANPDRLVSLKGVYKEVNAISEIVKSDVYIDDKATETSFKENAGKYAVLHLAMHTILNDEDPLYSRLVFTRNSKDTLNDNNLFTYEIYNMQISAKMTVLSSCSSGFGKMLRGEGLLSLARGFIYAGCPSIIMTLWQAPDNSSPELMTSFYRHLKRGDNKIEALRKAKIEYLKSSDGLWANPYFWSPFVVIGDNSPIYRKMDFFYWSLLIAGFGGLVVLSVLRLRRRMH